MQSDVSVWPEATMREVSLGIYDGPHATPKRREEGFGTFLGISSLVNGRLDLSKSDFVDEADFKKWTRRVTPQPGDLVFSYETRLGEAALIPKGLRCCLGRRMALVRPDPTLLDSKFLLYSYIGPAFQALLKARSVQGSTVDRILLKEFPDFPFTLPPLPEQRRIAAVLGALDDKIELNRKMNQTLEEMAQALFKSWFIDFDGHDPADLVDSELGPIPRGWSWGTLESVAALSKDKAKPETLPSDTPYVGLEHVPRHEVALYEHGLASDAGSSKSRFQKYDTLFGKLRPYFHKVVPAPTDGICSTDILVVRPLNKSARWFVFGHLYADSTVAHATASSSGTKMPRAKWKDLVRINIAVPPPKILADFDDHVGGCYERIFVHIEEAKTLADLRDALLPKLISGEIRVPEAEAAVGAAL